MARFIQDPSTSRPESSATAPAADYAPGPPERYRVLAAATIGRAFGYNNIAILSFGLFPRGSRSRNASHRLRRAARLRIGAEFDFMCFLVSRYQRADCYARNYSMTYAAYAIEGRLGPLLMSYSVEHFGSYQPAFWRLSKLPGARALRDRVRNGVARGRCKETGSHAIIL